MRGGRGDAHGDGGGAIAGGTSQSASRTSLASRTAIEDGPKRGHHQHGPYTSVRVLVTFAPAVLPIGADVAATVLYSSLRAYVAAGRVYGAGVSRTEIVP